MKKNEISSNESSEKIDTNIQLEQDTTLIPEECLNEMMQGITSDIDQENISFDTSQEVKNENNQKKITSNIEKGHIFLQKVKHVLSIMKRITASKLKAMKKNKQVSNENEIAKWKLFFVSDMDEEAEYLHSMSVQGFHFKEKQGMRYIFEKGTPMNYYYHLGYYENEKRDSDRYINNYFEAGWVDVFQEEGEFDGVWNYFRTEIPHGHEAPQIFSDKLSRLALYNRLMGNWRNLLIMIASCMLFLLFLFIFLLSGSSSYQHIYMIVWTSVFVVLLVTMLIYLRTYFKISNKMTELKYHL